MDENATAAANDAAVTGVDNINSEEGGVTAEEVAQVLNIKAPEAEEAPAASPEEEEPAEPEEPEAPKEEPKVEEPKEPVKEEAPAEESAAPSFSLEVEDANGNKYTINPGDSLEEVLADFEPKNNGQIFQIVKDSIKMEQAKEDHDAKQAKDKAEAEQAQKVADIQAGWDKEAEKLIAEKRLPATVEGKDNERLNEVFKFMADENQKRIEAGVPPIQTLEDALDKLELQEKKNAEAEAKKQAKEENRQRGGLVGGSSAPASNSGPSYAPAGGATNASQALKKMGLL